MNVIARFSILAADGQFEADNKWLPEAAEVLWGTLAFLIIVYVLWKYARLPIQKALRDRSERIGKELDDSSTARADAEGDVARIRENLANIDEERTRILAEATESAERIAEEGIVRNDAEVVELEARADADIELMRGRATSELQAQVATWAGEAAERIVAAQLDEATQQRLVEDFIAKVGASA